MPLRVFSLNTSAVLFVGAYDMAESDPMDLTAHTGYYRG